MMAVLLNAQKGAAQQAAQGRASTRHGTISSYDPNAYAVKVILQPDNEVTGWIPLKSPWIGNGWGLFCGPSVGDAVEVDYQEDDAGVGSVGWRFFNDADRPLAVPSGEAWIVHKDGAYLKFLNGGDVSLHAARDLIVDVARNLTATVGGDASVSVSGNATVAVTGNITSSAAQWNHTGPVSIIGTLNVKNTITGTGGLALSTTFGSAGGSAASITGNITANNGTFNGTTWDFVADGYSLKTHKHTGVSFGTDTSGPATP